MALAQSDEDLQAVARLRADRFRDNIAASDLDRFDPLCTHLLIRSGADQRPVGAARFRLLIGTQDVSSSYCAQFYDLSRLGEAGLRLLEIGRICITADQINQADVARALLAGLTRAALILRRYACGVRLLPGRAPGRSWKRAALFASTSYRARSAPSGQRAGDRI
ncbi:MAG: GNAT family N-acetyltransferase [Roseinatronobacter sp.]